MSYRPFYYANCQQSQLQRTTSSIACCTVYVDGYSVFDAYQEFNSGGIKLVYGDPANDPGVPA